MADETTESVKKYKNSAYFNYKPEEKYKTSIKYVDSMTGKPVDLNTITDSIRLARAGTNIRDIPGKRDTIVHQETMPTDLLNKFVTSPSSSYSPADAVSCLGLYITDYIVDRITSLGDKNSDLSANSKSFTDDMTFRTYMQGGANAFRNEDNTQDEPTMDNFDAATDSDLKSSKRISQDIGIGVGESIVINPTWQFNKRDDPRTNPMYTKIGRVYSTQLMKNWPIALIQPGRFKYHTSFFKLMGLGSGAGIQEALIRSGGDGLGATLLKFITAPIDAITVLGSVGSAMFGGNKVLEFKQAYNLFEKYAVYLYNTVASFMGLMWNGKYLGARKTLKLYDILPTMMLSGNAIKSFHSSQYIPFRCGKGITTNESFSNSFTENPIQEAMNAKAQENDQDNGSAVNVKDPVGSIFKAAKNVGMKLVGQFSEQALVLSGKGRISLPEVFASSSFSRSFSFDFKFHSPYGDSLSIFENEYIPFLTLLAMTAPRQIGKMTYTSPFALRISVRNKIMINYGMVESLTVTRGGDSNDWTPSGFPKTITCSLSIKDLEPNISLPLASRGPVKAAVEAMFPSSGISEYLASIGGLTIEDVSVFFSKHRLNRTMQAFSSSWNAYLDFNSLMSTVINSSPVSNIASLFTSSDLDAIANDKEQYDISQNLKSGVLSYRGNMPSSLNIMRNMNGQGGKNAYLSEEDTSAISLIGDELEKSNYY